MKKSFIFLFLAALLTACGGPSQQGQAGEKTADLPREAFFKNLSALCGKTFEGVVIFPDVPSEAFRDSVLLMRVATCNDNEILIPFEVGADKSRTWMISLRPEGMLFKHDHRHEDGTPDEVTNYGGFADAGGTAFQQNFPADAFTAELLPEAATNMWRLRLSEDGKTFSYILERHGNPRFQADFDLSRPLGQNE